LELAPKALNIATFSIMSIEIQLATERSLKNCITLRQGFKKNSSPSGCRSRTGFLYPLSRSRFLVSCMRSACPLCIGLRNWNAKTASA